MGQVLHDEVLTRIELELHQFIQKNCIYRARVKYGEEPLLRWTGKGPINGGAERDGEGQFYLQRAFMNPLMAEYVGKLFWERCWDIWEKQRFQICAAEPAVPVASAITSAGMWLGRSILKQSHGLFDVNAFYVRKQRKLYGLENYTEGMIEPDIPIMLVDDATNSKRQTVRMHRILIELGFKVLPVSFSVLRFNKNDNTMPHEDVRFIFQDQDFSPNFGERWEECSYDDSRGRELDEDTD